MRTMTTSVAKTCPDCGVLNRLVIHTTGLTPVWRIGCSHCGGTLVERRAPIAPASAEIVPLPVPYAQGGARGGARTLPARRGAPRAVALPGRRRGLVGRLRRAPSHASTGMSFLAACGFAVALMLPDWQPEPAGAPAEAGPVEVAVAAAVPDTAARVPSSAQAATGPAAPTVPAWRLAAEDALGARPAAYPDPLEGMMGLQLAALHDPAAAAAAEEELALSAGTRREVQRRLRLAEHDPKGIDGIFGPATRAAISEWQEHEGLPATGYLTGRALARLVDRTETQYAAWSAGEKARRERERQFAAVVPPARVQRVAADGCPRHGSGEIAYGATVRCDVRGLRENLGSLRDNLAGLFERPRSSPWEKVRRRPGDA